MLRIEGTDLYFVQGESLNLEFELEPIDEIEDIENMTGVFEACIAEKGRHFWHCGTRVISKNLQQLGDKWLLHLSHSNTTPLCGKYFWSVSFYNANKSERVTPLNKCLMLVEESVKP